MFKYFKHILEEEEEDNAANAWSPKLSGSRHRHGIKIWNEISLPQRIRSFSPEFPFSITALQQLLIGSDSEDSNMDTKQKGIQKIREKSLFQTEHVNENSKTENAKQNYEASESGSNIKSEGSYQTDDKKDAQKPKTQFKSETERKSQLKWKSECKIGRLQPSLYQNANYRLAGFDPLSLPGIQPLAADLKEMEMRKQALNDIVLLEDDDKVSEPEQKEKKRCQSLIENITGAIKASIGRQRSVSVGCPSRKSYMRFNEKKINSRLNISVDELVTPTHNVKSSDIFKRSDSRFQSQSDDDIFEESDTCMLTSSEKNCHLVRLSGKGESNEQTTETEEEGKKHILQPAPVLQIKRENAHYKGTVQYIVVPEIPPSHSLDNVELERSSNKLFGTVGITLQMELPNENLQVQIGMLERSPNTFKTDAAKQTSYIIKVSLSCISTKSHREKKTKMVKGAGVVIFNDIIKFNDVSRADLRFNTVQMELFEVDKSVLSFKLKTMCVARCRLSLENFNTKTVTFLQCPMTV